MKTTTRIILATTLALAFAGCATVNTVTPANPEATPNRVADKRIITDSSLNDIAYVVEVDKAMVGDLPRVQVQLRNLSSGPKNVNYKFEWVDKQGMAITAPAPIWQTISLEGGESSFIGSTATSPNAADWKLDLLESTRRTPGLLP